MAFKWLRFLFAASGDRTAIPQATDPSGNVSYEQGYGPDYQRPKTDPLSKNIERDKMNALFFDLTGNVQHYQLNGVPDFVPAADNGGVAVSYPIGARVRDAATSLIYVSNTAANTGVPGVSANWRLEKGQFLGVQVLSASGTFTRTPGARSGLLRMVGGGAGGSGSQTTTASQVSGGVGGGSGSYLEHFFDGNLPASQAYTIGAGGVAGPANGVGGAGGNTVFGALTAPGAAATALGGVFAPPWMVLGGDPGAPASGGNIINAIGQQGGTAFALALAAFTSGAGGNSQMGAGGKALGTTTGGGFGAQSPGAGGAGGISGSSTPGQPGGGGGAGRIVVYEFS